MGIAKYWTQAQELNWRYGVFRIWIVLSVIWCGALTVAGIAAYIKDVGHARQPSGEGLFGDIPITNPPASSLLPSADTLSYFLVAVLVPVAVFLCGKAFALLLSWIYGGFKAEEVVEPDYIGACRKAAQATGRWSLNIFLYVLASVVIAALLSVMTVKIYQWLDISLDGNYALTNPFVLLGILLQFAAFKWIFFREAKKGTAFLAYVAVSLFLLFLIGAVAVIA